MSELSSADDDHPLKPADMTFSNLSVSLVSFYNISKISSLGNHIICKYAIGTKWDSSIVIESLRINYI